MADGLLDFFRADGLFDFKNGAWQARLADNGLKGAPGELLIRDTTPGNSSLCYHEAMRREMVLTSIGSQSRLKDAPFSVPQHLLRLRLILI